MPVNTIRFFLVLPAGFPPTALQRVVRVLLGASLVQVRRVAALRNVAPMQNHQPCVNRAAGKKVGSTMSGPGLDAVINLPVAIS